MMWLYGFVFFFFLIFIFWFGGFKGVELAGVLGALSNWSVFFFSQRLF